MTTPLIGYEDAIHRISWHGAIESLHAGHMLPRATVADVFLGPSDAKLLNRSAYIEGLGYGVKAVTVIRDNARRGLATTQGAMSVFKPVTGELVAMIDSRLITEIKTVSDSLLGAKLLARPDSKRLLIVGGGVIAQSLLVAYPQIFPTLEQVAVWTRRPEQAQSLVAEYRANSNTDIHIVAADSLPAFAERADIISTATMAQEPILCGDWITPGAHVDLIGAFKSDMREADDALMAKAQVYVDSRDTTIEHIGELLMPIASGVLSAGEVLGDLYDLVSTQQASPRPEAAITVFKNGGGAHLDLMIARYILDVLRVHDA